jgi:hypothetical protein
MICLWAVILFVLRMLKALDFQPRMALVTRTISSAFSDLFHFLVLFSVIFIGYAFAGNQLFGHQFEGLSSLDNACQFLILILLSFDPTQMWVQVFLREKTQIVLRFKDYNIWYTTTQKLNSQW